MESSRSGEFRRRFGGLALCCGFVLSLLVSPERGGAAGVALFEATPVHGRRVDLSWAAVAGAEGYRVARSCPGDDAQGLCPVATLPRGVLSFADTSVEPGEPYTYRVEALVEGGVESASASVRTPAPASLPASTPPIYPAPQGAWSLGDPVSLDSIKRLRILHNLASRGELRILLDAKDSHSLVSRLEGADYAVAFKRRASTKIPPGEAEIYFHNFSRKASVTGLPPGVQPFARMGDEGYVLVAEGAGPEALRIVVGANTPEGLFRGGLAVERLLIDAENGRRRSRFEPVVVLDYPDHPRRGAYPSWKPMSATWSLVPEKALDMLDSIARAGANSVDWMDNWPAQEEYSWETFGARSAALVQIEAARRFIDVNYFMGSVFVSHGTQGPPEVDRAQVSVEQDPYGDGLGVFKEPFYWVQVEPGRWRAMPERQGRFLSRRVSSAGTAWGAVPCSKGGWHFGPQSPGTSGSPARAWQLSGRAQDCELIQSVDVQSEFSGGRYFLEGRVRGSGDLTGLEGTLALEVEAEDKKYRYSIPIEVSGEASGEGRQLGLVIPALGIEAPIDRARLVARASVGSGSLWLDGFELRAWDREFFPSGTFGRAGDWQLGSGQGGLEIDNSIGRTDTKSLATELPLGLGPGEGAKLAQTYSSIRLEEGRYVFGAWVRAARPDSATLAPDRDRDRDGLDDRFESGTGRFEGPKDTGTDPGDPDSDGDGSPDGVEVMAGSDPTNELSEPSKTIAVKADINLYLFEQASVRPGQAGRKLASEFLAVPARLNLDSGDWLYIAHFFEVSADLARRVQSARVQVRFFESSQAGQIWIDDIDLRRLDGDLRNLRGAASAPSLESASGRRLSEGVDYEICQVGDRKTLCSAPENYTQMLEGGQGAIYDLALNPFEIRWIGKAPPAEKGILVSYDVGAQYSSVASPRVEWDGQKTVSTVLNLCEFDAVAQGIELERILGHYLDGHVLQNFPSWGETYTFRADSVTWGVSEVRGVNRSVACLDDDGNLRHSNAALFAQVVNKVFSATMKKHPGAHFWLWADMFNPFSNGGDKDYQLRFGGEEGRSACALAPSLLPSLCASEVKNVPLPILDHVQAEGGSILMKPWSYPPFTLRRMVAVAAWYQELGIRSQFLSGASPINVDDWAAIANTFSAIEGGVSTVYLADRYGGRSGLIRGLQAFWNHDWRLLYLFDGESPSSSFYQIAWPFEPILKLENATADPHGGCAVFSEKFEGNSDGGICLDPSVGQSSITLEKITIDGGARYRVDLMARSQKHVRGNNIAAPKVFGTWSTGEATGPIVSTLIYQSSKFRSPNTFDRYRAEFQAPVDAEGLSLEIQFSEYFEAVDDIAIFESFRACFDDCSTPLEAPSQPFPQN
ncbi:MAG: hypothetical protein OSB70_09085 [Myxococcota bacterium]|nr:hypothetical protein [Myxococcota bacterium]